MRHAPWVVLSVCALLAPTAWAQRGGAPPDRIEEMRELFERGQTAYQRGEYEVAASEFRAAQAIRPAAALVFNEAVCYEKLGDPARAVKLFRRYLDAAPDAADRDEVRRRIVELQNGTRKAPAGADDIRNVVFVVSEPPGATVYLDSKLEAPVGTTPWNGTVTGSHELIVVAPGYKDTTTRITARPRAIQEFHVALSKVDFLGFLEVRANLPHADVYLDDAAQGAVGRTPYLGDITTGKHVVIVRREGFTEERHELDVVGGQAYKIDATLARAEVGFVDVHGATAEGAVVRLDGQKVCQAPCRFASPSGAHTVTVEKPGRKAYRHRLEIGQATETRLAVRLAVRRSRTDLIWKFGLAAAALGGGAYLGLQARNVRNEIESEMSAGMPPLPADDGRYQRGKLYALGADGLFVLGGAMAAYGVASLFWEPGPSSTGESYQRELQPGFSMAPAVAPGYGGVAARVRF